MSLSTRTEQAIGNYVVEVIKDEISNGNIEPSGLFDEQELEAWAEGNGFVKKTE